MKARPHSEVVIASNLDRIRGDLSLVLNMLDRNACVAPPTKRERDRSDKVLEALGALRAANALSLVTL